MIRTHLGSRELVVDDAVAEDHDGSRRLGLAILLLDSVELPVGKCCDFLHSRNLNEKVKAKLGGAYELRGGACKRDQVSHKRPTGLVSLP